MRFKFDKNKALSSSFLQMLIIVVAFTIMGISSFLFASRIERKHLIKDATNILALAESEITAILIEPEMFLYNYSETIRSKIINGASIEELSSYIKDVTSFSFRDDYRSISVMGSHNYFYIDEGVYISGRSWVPPEEYVPQDSSWYKTSAAANGNITVSDPYRDSATGISIVTLSRYLYDDEENSMGVVCITFDFTNAYKHAIGIDFTNNSYGILLNNNLEIIAHPAPYLLGERIDNFEGGFANLTNVLSQGLNAYEYKFVNYMYDSSIAFLKKMKYDWHLGIVIPTKEYFRNIYLLAVFLFLLGSVMAVLLCIMCYYISRAKIKSDQKTQHKSNFLATISHEIRTPLNAILGMTEIQMQNSTHPPSTSEAFIKINNSGNLLLSIINDVLDLSKIEAGKLELTPIKYEVASLVNDVVQLNYIRYESKPIEFKIDIHEDTPSILVGDELRIKQILNNLLSNAFKYTDKGQVTLSAGAECVGRGGIVQVTLIFKVIDTGHGMTAGQVSKLFDEYTRFNLETNRTTEGAGLGMTITRNLINLMNGKITVKSTVGEGTAVTVRIPQKTDGIGISSVIGKELAETLQHFKVGNAIQLKKTQVQHEHMPYGSVLIVDDVETNLYVAKGLMTPYGLNIDLATSGYEAIDKIKEGNYYDIVFMDHMMPKMDGIETTKQLREIGYNRPIVALTANAIAGQAEVFLKNGFDGFISKPIDIRQLNVSLNKLIRDKQPIEVIESAQREKIENDKKRQTAAENIRIDPQLAGIFARDAEKAIAVLENILQKNFQTESDIQLYVINVHAMKSALANINKQELSAVALRLEQAGREKNLNMMVSETNNFLEALKSVVTEIKPEEEDDSNIEDSKEALVLLQKKLTILKEACQSFDKKEAKNTLNELREKTWSHKVKELLNIISEHLLHSEFDTAITLIDEFLEN